MYRPPDNARSRPGGGGFGKFDRSGKTIINNTPEFSDPTARLQASRLVARYRLSWLTACLVAEMVYSTGRAT